MTNNNNNLRALTHEIITMPLREALLMNNIDEDSVIKVMAKILNDENAKDSDRLRCIHMFISWLGLVHQGQQTVTLQHDVRDAIEMLDRRRLQRLDSPDVVQPLQIVPDDTEIIDESEVKSDT